MDNPSRRHKAGSDLDKPIFAMSRMSRRGMGEPGERSDESTGREVEDELRLQTKHFQPVLKISPTAIVITDLDNSVASWNPAAERLFGYTQEEAAGRDLDDLVATTAALHAEADEFLDPARQCGSRGAVGASGRRCGVRRAPHSLPISPRGGEGNTQEPERRRSKRMGERPRMGSDH